MGCAMVDLYCELFAKVPKRITLDIDDTFDAVHGGQQLRLFNAHYEEYGFQPIVVFDGDSRVVTAVLRPAKRPSGKEIKPFLRRLLRAIRARWPHTEILLRADSHYCGPEVLDWCRANGLAYLLGVAPTTTLRRHVDDLEASTKARFEAAPRDGKLRRFKEFFDGAQSWSRVQRIIARVEVGEEGSDTRFVVTNLQKRNARCTKTSIADAARPKTTSSRGHRGVFPKSYAKDICSRARVRYRSLCRLAVSAVAWLNRLRGMLISANCRRSCGSSSESASTTISTVSSLAQISTRTGLSPKSTSCRRPDLPRIMAWDICAYEM